MRSDLVLSLSEDLPVVALAVDEAPRIEALLDDVLAIRNRGLVTIERVREGAAVPLPAELGEAAKLSVLLGRRDRAAGAPAHVAVCALLRDHGVDGATALLGVDGTLRGRRERAAFLGRNAAVPQLVLAVGAGPRIAAALEPLRALVPGALLTLERVRVCKRDGRLLAAPHELPGSDEQGRALHQKLTVYSSAAATRGGRPLHLEILHALRRAGAAGATSVRGIWGFHGGHRPHGDRLLALRRRVPVVTSAIDTPERCERWFELIDEITVEQGLVTSEMVPAIDALPLARHRY